MPKAITRELLKSYSQNFNGSRERQMSTLAFSKSEINDVSYVFNSVKDVSYDFSINIETLPATNQEKTGRCWLFSATNILRERIAKKLNVDNFEISQSYLAFWDKFERANYMLENIMATADLPVDDRNVSFILSTGVHDGGQWEMFANIVRKYGIVPKEPIAKQAIGRANIVCITGAEMKEKLAGYLNILFEQVPTSVGGTLPADDFYYGA